MKLRMLLLIPLCGFCCFRCRKKVSTTSAGTQTEKRVSFMVPAFDLSTERELKLNNVEREDEESDNKAPVRRHKNNKVRRR